MPASPQERFLDACVGRGVLSADQAADCRRLRAACAEVGIDLSPDDVAVRRGYVARERADALLRELARLRVGRYEVIERIGEGGAGVVWRARDTELGRTVALKLMTADARRDPRWRERFLREARVALTLDHDHVVRGLDCGDADGYVFFAMELLPGGSVADRIRRDGRLPERDALAAARDAASALAHVQRFGIVHRDVKPENLLYAEDGSVKLCDLGLARPMREEAERGDGAVAVAGTPLYMSPEQVRDPVHVDWRSDVYNLGATLFHMLTGRPPFPWEPGRDVLQRHLDEPPPSPREIRLDVSSGAAAVTLKMLRKDPAERYASFAALAEDLDSVLAGRPPLHTVTFAADARLGVDAAAARAVAHAARDRRRWQPALVGTGVALAGLAATAALALWLADAVSGPHPVELSPPPSAPPTGAGPGADPQPPASSSAASEAPSDGPRRALAGAERVSSERPHDFAARRDAWAFVVDRHPDTPEAAVAAERLRGVLAEIEAAAEEELRRCAERAGAAEASGRYGQAIAQYEAFPADLRGSQAARRAEAEVRRLGTEAIDRLRRHLDEAHDLAARRRFAEAFTRLEAAADLGVPDALREIHAARREIDAAAAAWESAREAQRPRFERVYGSAVLEAGTHGVDAALAALERAGPEIAAWSDETRALAADLQRIPQADPSPGAAAPPQTLRDAFFAQLALGRLGAAADLRERIASAGSRHDDLDAALGRVRAVLVSAAEDHLVLAEQARAAGRPDEAGEHTRRALAQIPRYPRALTAQAAVLADAGRTEAAIDLLVEVLSASDPPAVAHLRLGQVLAARPPDAERARRELELFLALAPDGDPLRAEARALLESLQGRRTEAALRGLRESLRRALTRDDAAGAIEAGEAILVLSPDDTEALVALGETYPEVGRVRDGWRALRRVADRGGTGTALARAARSLRRVEERWAATPAARKDAAAARALLDAGDAAAAAASFDAVLRSAPLLDEALAGAAEARLATAPRPSADEVRQAQALLDDLVLRNPAHVRAYELRAEALAELGEWQSALDDATRALRAGSLRPEPATVAGFASLRLGDADAALGHFRESLDRRRTAAALLGRALAWIDHRDFANARAEMDMLVREFGVPDRHGDEVRAVLTRLEMEVVEPSDEK